MTRVIRSPKSRKPLLLRVACKLLVSWLLLLSRIEVLNVRLVDGWEWFHLYEVV